MGNQLLPDVPRPISAAAIILGDSRRPETVAIRYGSSVPRLAQMLFFPAFPHDKIDIVPANYVGKAIVTIHQKEAPAHGIYHFVLRHGIADLPGADQGHCASGGMIRPMFGRPWGDLSPAWSIGVANRTGAAAYGASLLKVFWPYLDWNTVFDNSSASAELGEVPAKFSSLCLSALEIQAAITSSGIRPSPGHPIKRGRKLRGGKRGRMTDFLLIAWSAR